jgi:hypothetical protein
MRMTSKSRLAASIVIPALMLVPAIARAQQELSSTAATIPSSTDSDCPNCLSSSTGTVTLTFRFDVRGGIQQPPEPAEVGGAIPPAGATVQSYYLAGWDMGGASVSQIRMTHGGFTYPILSLDLNTGAVTYASAQFPWTSFWSGSLVSAPWEMGITVVAYASPLDYTLKVVFAINWLAPPPKPAPTCVFSEEPVIVIASGVPADEFALLIRSAPWHLLVSFAAPPGALSIFGGTDPTDLTLLGGGTYSEEGFRSRIVGAQENTTYYVRLDYQCSNGASASRSLSLRTPSSPIKIGCFVDAPMRALPVSLGVASPWACIGAAAAAGYSFAGRQNGDQCFAGNSLGHTRAYDADCNTPCTGSSQFNCGGAWRNLIFATGIQPVSKIPPPLPAPETLYVGCFHDFSTRTLPVLLMASGATVESCIDTALGNGYSYAGVQNGGECHAGNALPGVAAPESDCAASCSANSAQFCGGAWRNSVYRTPAFPLMASSSAGDGIHLEWADPASDHVSLVVERQRADGGAYSQVASLEPSALSYDDAGLSLFVLYRYRITAKSPTGAVSAHSIQTDSLSGSSVACLAAILGGL